jgi:hypothetical protein
MQPRLPAILAITTGLLTLVALLFVPPLGQSLLQWGSIIAAFVLIVGLINLIAVHTRRITQQRNPLSLVVVLSFFTVFLFGLTDIVGLTNNWVGQTYTLILRPLEIAFTALLAIILLVAGVRFVRQQRTIWAILFLLSAIFVLFSSLPLPLLQDNLGTLFSLYNDMLIPAGVRGLLLGIALATMVIAGRILLGADQPYNK